MEQSFAQQPKESGKAFAAFSLYLSSGKQRSLEAASQKLAKSKALMEWVERVAAHSGHLAKVEAEAQEVQIREKAAQWGKRQQELREEEWSIHEECIRAGRKALERFYEREKGATLGDIARILETASKLGRLASGLATDKTEVTGADGGAIRIELEAALKKVYSQAEPGSNVVDVGAVPMLTEGK